MRLYHPACIARVAALGEIGEHVGLFDRPHGLERQQFRIARPGADAVQASGRGHMPAFDSALMQAAVMALPPMRPRTTA